MKKYGIILLSCIGVMTLSLCVMGDDVKLHTVKIKSTLDGEIQLARMFTPAKAGKNGAPLLVVLHTWSGNYKQDHHAGGVFCLSAKSVAG